jgi:hypothetical protein
MKNLLFCVLIFLLSIFNSYSQQRTADASKIIISDGPYIYYENDSLKAFWITKNLLEKEYVNPENFPVLKKKFNLTFNFGDLYATRNIKQNHNQRFSKVDSIGIIGDIHGGYKTYIDLLKSMGIIDKDLNWKFGKGHLMVTGDIFDRGDKVTEVLWHLFGLEKQAEDAGGEVHLLLGNHELMVIDNELSYINNKYKKVEELSGKGYNELYSASYILGSWLRSKPVIVTINDILFVHAGLSSEMVQRKMNTKRVNQLFGDDLNGRPLDSISANIDLPFLFTDLGPIWYRGYFSGTDFNESKLDSILNYYGKKHIIVGHTTIQTITSLYNYKIIGVDTGIMFGKSPEMLLYKEGVFYRSSLIGTRTKL